MVSVVVAVREIAEMLVAPVMAPDPEMSKEGVSNKVVKVPLMSIPVVMVPPPVSTMLMALVRLPAELVISMASVIPEFAATSINRALSTKVVPAAVVSSCWSLSRASVFVSVKLPTATLLRVTRF